MSERTTPSVAELEETLSTVRKQMMATVDELTDKISPAAQFEQVKEQVAATAGQAGEAVKGALAKGIEAVLNEVDKAAEGDTKSRVIVYGSIAAGALLVLGLAARAIKR